MHGSKPVARRDVREVTCGQVAVGLEAILYAEALQLSQCKFHGLVLAISLALFRPRRHNPHAVGMGT